MKRNMMKLSPKKLKLLNISDLETDWNIFEATPTILNRYSSLSRIETTHELYKQHKLAKDLLDAIYEYEAKNNIVISALLIDSHYYSLIALNKQKRSDLVIYAIFYPYIRRNYEYVSTSHNNIIIYNFTEYCDYI